MRGALEELLQLGEALHACSATRGSRPTGRRPSLASSPPLAKIHEMPLRQSGRRCRSRTGCRCVERLARVSLNSSSVVGTVDAGCRPDVLAVEDVARTEVVRQRVVRAVDRADLDEGLEQLVAAELVVHVADVAERTDVGERRRPGVADLGDVGGVLGVGKRGGELGESVAPALLLDGEGAAGGILVLGLEVVAQRVGGVATHQPERDVLPVPAEPPSLPPSLPVVAQQPARTRAAAVASAARPAIPSLHCGFLTLVRWVWVPCVGAGVSGVYETPSCPERTMTAAPRRTMSLAPARSSGA